MQSHFDLDELRARLIAMRATAAERIRLRAERAAPVELDQTRVGRISRMDAMQQQAQAAESRAREQLTRIDAALARMAKGTYGYCAICEAPIALARLLARPEVTRCIDCATAGRLNT